MAVGKGKQVATATVGLQFVADGSGLGRAAKQIEGQLVALQRRTSTVGKSMAGIVPAFAATGGAAFAAFRFATQQAIQFEDSFAGIKKTLNFTDSQVTTTQQKFKNLALEIRNLAKETPISVNELNKIGEIGGQLGISATGIGKFVDTISKLTVATTMGAEDAAFAISRLSNITGTAEQDLDNLASVLVRLGNEFAATESEIINTSLGIATAMEALSSDFTNSAVDALAFATALKAVGVQSQSGATAVQRALDTLGKAVSNGGRELGLFAELAGMTETAFKQLVSIDPARAFLAFLKGLEAVGNAGGNTFAVLEELGLSQQRTVRALRAMAFASEDVERALGTANEEFAINTALTTEAEKRYETFTSQLGILRNNINEIGISMGGELLPVMTDVVQGLTTISAAVVDLDDDGNIRNNHLSNFLINMGIAATTAMTGLKAFKNVADELSTIPGTGPEGGSSLFGDILGMRTGTGQALDIEVNEYRKSYLKQLDAFYAEELGTNLNHNKQLGNAMVERAKIVGGEQTINEFKKQLEGIDDYSRNFFENMVRSGEGMSLYQESYTEGILKNFEKYKALAEDGSFQFLDIFGDKTLGIEGVKMTDSMFAGLAKSQGFDTRQIEKLMYDAKKLGVSAFDPVPMDIDVENMTEKQQLTKQLQDKIIANLQSQVTTNDKLNIAADQLLDKTDALEKANKKIADIKEEIFFLEEQARNEVDTRTETSKNLENQIEAEKDFIESRGKMLGLTDEQIAADIESSKKLKNLENQLATNNKFLEEATHLKNLANDATIHGITVQEESLRLEKQIITNSQAANAESKRFLELYETVLDQSAQMKLIENQIEMKDELGLTNEQVIELEKSQYDLAEATRTNINEMDDMVRLYSDHMRSTQTLVDTLETQIFNIDKQLRELKAIPVEIDEYGDFTSGEMERQAKIQELETNRVGINEDLTQLKLEQLRNAEAQVFKANLLKNLEKDREMIGEGIANIVQEQINATLEEVKVLEQKLADYETIKGDLYEQLDTQKEQLKNAKNIKQELDDTVFANDKNVGLGKELEKIEQNISGKKKEQNNLLAANAKLEEKIQNTRDAEKRIKPKGKDGKFTKGQQDERSRLLSARRKAEADVAENLKEIDTLENQISSQKEKQFKTIKKALGKNSEYEKVTKDILNIEKNIEKTKSNINNADVGRLQVEKEIRTLLEQEDGSQLGFNDKLKDTNKITAKLLDLHKDLATLRKNGKLDNEEINKIIEKQIGEFSTFVQENASNLADELQRVESAISSIDQATNAIKDLRTELVTGEKDVELLDKQINQIKSTLTGLADEGVITQSVVDDFINQVGKADFEGITDVEGNLLGIGSALEKASNVLRSEQAFAIPDSTKVGYKELKKIIGQLDRGLFNMLANFVNKFSQVNVETDEFGKKIRIVDGLSKRMFKGLGRLFAGLLRTIGFIGPSAVANFRTLEVAISNSTNLTNNLRASMLRLVGVIRGVATAVMGLVANFAMMAGMMAVMTTAMQVMQNLAKTESAIKGVGDIMSGFFEGAESRAELQANKTELERLLKEYSSMGEDYAEIVEAIQQRLDENNRALAESNADFRESMGEIGTKLLFETTVNDEIGDLTKRTEAIAKYIGLRGEAETQLFKDNLSDAIGEQMIEGDISPRDLAESLVDVEGFTKESRTVFDSIIGSIEDNVNMVYDMPDYSTGLRNYFEVNQGALLDWFRTNGDLGQIITEGQIFGSPADAESAIADSITNFFVPGSDFQDHFDRNMMSQFGLMRIDVSDEKIQILMPDEFEYNAGTFGEGFTERLIGEIDINAIKLTKEFNDEYNKAIEKYGIGNVDEDLIAGNILQSIVGELSTKEGLEKFRKDFSGLVTLANSVISQSFEISDSGLAVIQEMQNQAILAELRQFQNQGVIDEIIFPSKDRLGAERQLSVARAVMLEKARTEAEALKDELDLAELSADKFSKTLKENLTKSAQELGNVFEGVPVQIRKSVRKIVEELMVKAAMQKKFEQLIKQISTFAPMLAEQLSRQGVAAMNLAEEVLRDRTAGFQIEGMLATIMPDFAKELGLTTEQIDNTQQQAIKIGKALADGLLLGLQNAGVIDLDDEMINKINASLDAAAGPDGADSRSPSKKTTKIGESLAEGFAVGIENFAEKPKNKMIELIDKALMAARGPEGADIYNPSRKTELIGKAMGEGVVKGIDSVAPDAVNAMINLVDNSIFTSGLLPDPEDLEPEKIQVKITSTGEEPPLPELDPEQAMRLGDVVDEIYNNVIMPLEDSGEGLYATWEQGLAEIKGGLDVIFGLTGAARALTAANYAVQKSEQALMAVRREQASFSERYLKHQIHLQKMEKEGRKGVITGAEELSILKQKVALQEMLDRSQGKRSANERLAIQRAEEEFEKLKLAAEAGIVTSLEVDAAEEDLKKLKGEDLSEDEQRIAVLELAQAQKQLDETEDKAKETSEELIAAREKQVTLTNEAANASYELQTAYDQLEASLDAVVLAEHSYETAREKFRVFAGSAGELFEAIIDGYGGVGSHIDLMIKKSNNFATAVETDMRKATEAVRKYLSDRALLDNRLDDPQQEVTFNEALGQMFGNAQGFQNLVQQKVQGTGTLGVEEARAKGQFKDDTEMNLAKISAERVRSGGMYTKMASMEVVRALEGLFGIPFTLTAAGQIAVSEQGLEQAGLMGYRDNLIASGIQVYDTNEKLAMGADSSRTGESGTRAAGYIPNIGTTSIGKTKEFTAIDLNKILPYVYGNGVYNQSQLLGAVGLNPDINAYQRMLQDYNNWYFLNTDRRRQVEDYFTNVQRKLQEGLDDLGLTNYSVLRGFKYGGFMKPFQRALVGEYGPEMVTAVPGGGLRVQPEGGRGASINVSNLNVNVTGVPSDPIQARKAAQQIQKALVKLGKEGNTGTGLRRN